MFNSNTKTFFLRQIFVETKLLMLAVKNENTKR